MNKTMADRLFAGRGPVGKRLRIEPGARIDQVVEIVGLFGYAALELTACVSFAVSAHALAARSRELGIRAAPGAPPRGQVTLVLRTDFAAVVAGLGAGLIAARAAASALDGLLFEVRPGDPGPYVAVAILLAAVGAAAC